MTKRPEGDNSLTIREIQVCNMIARSMQNKQIAHELRIAPKTVDNYRQRLMMKIHQHDVAGVTRYAIARGYVDANYGL